MRDVPLQVVLAGFGYRAGHDPLLRILAAQRAVETLSDDSTAESMLATYTQIYKEMETR